MYGHATIGCRKIVRVLQVFANQVDFAIPHHTTIRQWIIRYGCHNLQTPLDKANDWIVIGDLTISAGKLKCLATLGVRKSKLETKEDLTLSHKDVAVLGLYPTKKSTGEFVNECLEDSAKRIGGSFLSAVTDQGSDMKKGATSFKKNHPEVIILHDIAHKLSNIVEQELKKDPKWLEYTKELTLCRQKSYQTEFAGLMPKKQREKARFMDIGHLVYWPERVHKSKSDGCLCNIAEERYQEYLGWTDRFAISLNEWGYIEGIVDMIKGSIRVYGLSEDIYLYLKMFLEEANMEGDRLQKFVLKALNAVREEVEKLDEGQTMISSTEVLESVFGKYKAINEAIHGVTSSILGILTFVGGEKNERKITEAMENCSVKKAEKYVREKFGETLCTLRRRFFPVIKRTKFDTRQEVVFTP